MGSDAQTSDVNDTLRRLYKDNPENKISELPDHRPSDSVVARQHQVHQALANEDRLRLLGALRDGELCGCELMVVLDAPQPTVATHLRKLREAGLVKKRKKGKWTYYRIADGAVLDLLDLATTISDVD